MSMSVFYRNTALVFCLSLWVGGGGFIVFRSVYSCCALQSMAILNSCGRNMWPSQLKCSQLESLQKKFVYRSLKKNSNYGKKHKNLFLSSYIKCYMGSGVKNLQKQFLTELITGKYMTKERCKRFYSLIQNNK